MTNNRWTPFASMQLRSITTTLPHMWHCVLQYMARVFWTFSGSFPAVNCFDWCNTHIVGCVSLRRTEWYQLHAHWAILARHCFVFALFPANFRSTLQAHDLRIRYVAQRIKLHMCAKFQTESMIESDSPGVNRQTEFHAPQGFFCPVHLELPPATQIGSSKSQETS